VSTTNNIQVLDLTLDNTLNWKIHIDLTLSKLNTFYIINKFKQLLTRDTLIMTYCLFSFNNDL
jgi:hypothetical protein